MALATTTIGELNPGGPLQGTDQFVVERVGGNNFRITADEVSTFVGGGGSLASLSDVDLTGQAIGGLLVNVDGVNWNDLPVGSESNILTVVGGIPTWQAGGGGGEVNLGANVGIGTGLIFRDKTGVTLNFKSLIAGANITINNNADDIEIISTGGGASPTLAQGDMIARGLVADERVPIGTVGQFLTISTIASNLVVWRTIWNQLVEDEGIALAQRNTINFVGLGVTVTDVGGKTTVTIPGGADVLTTKGDLLSFDTIPNRLPVGSNGQVLEADSAEALGVKWGAAGLGHVIEEEGTPLVQRSNLNFAGPGVFVSDANPDTLVTIKGFTGQNVGTGLGEVFKTVVPTDFVQFRSLLAGTNIVITNGTDDITFDVPNSYETIEDAGTPVAQEKVLNFTGAGVTVSAGAGETIIDITGGVSPTTTQGDLIARNLTTDDRVPIGAPGQVLSVTTVGATLLTWVENIGEGYRLVQEEGVSLPAQNAINFIGTLVTATDQGGGVTAVTIVSPLTTKGDIYTWDTADARLGVGTDGQVLTANSAVGLGIEWQTPPTTGYVTVQDEGVPIVQRDTIDFVGAGVLVTDVASVTTVTIGGATSPLTTKGDVFGFDTGDARIPVGTNGQVLTANSVAALGVEWATPAAVTSPLTTLGDLYGFSTVDARIPVGSPGQHLTVLTAQPTSIGWSTPTPFPALFYQTVEDEGVAEVQRAIINFTGAGVTVADNVTKTDVDIPGFTSPLTTQGDLFARNLTVDARLPIGTANQVLAVSTATPTLMNWVTLATNFYQTVQDEGVAEIQRTIINFVGAGVSVADVANVTTVTIAGSASPLTTKGDLFTFDTGDARLPVGTNGQILSANSVQATGLEWIAAPGGSPLTTQGDLFSHNLTVDDRLPIGAAGQVLTVVTAGATLLAWQTPATAYIRILEDGASLTQRIEMNFIGTMVTAVDNVGATRTDITIASPLTTQGDIFVRNLTVDERLPIGSPGQVLTVLTGAATALTWATPVDTPQTPIAQDIAYAGFAITALGNVTFDDAKNIAFNATVGTIIGTATTQKFAFWGATPIVQPVHIADATDAASVITQLNALLAQIAALGLQASA